MTWIPPITDRSDIDLINKTPKAYFNAEDINRIEGNTEYLANRLVEIYAELESLMVDLLVPPETPGCLPNYDPGDISIVTKTDWQTTDFVRRDDSNRIVNNVRFVEAVIADSEGYPKYLDIESLDGMTLAKANNIEVAINAVYHYIDFAFREYKKFIESQSPYGLLVDINGDYITDIYNRKILVNKEEI